MLDKIENELISNKKKIIQVYGWFQTNTTLCLLMLANYFVSIGKIVIYLNYGNVSLNSRIKKYKFKELNKDKFIVVTRPSLDDFLSSLSNLNIEEDNTVIIIDSLDFLQTASISSPAKQCLFYEMNLKKLQLFSNKVIFSNSMYQLPGKYNLPTSTINVTVDNKIEVDYINIEENDKFFKTIKRKSIINNIIDE